MHGVNTSAIHYCNYCLGGFHSFRLGYRQWTSGLFDPVLDGRYLKSAGSRESKSKLAIFSILSKLLLDIHVIQFLVS